MKKLISAIALGIALASGITAGFAQTNTMSVRLDDETRKLLLNTTEDKWFKKDNFVSALLGGALAVAGGLVASWYSHRLQAGHKKQEDAEFRANVLSAI